MITQPQPVPRCQHVKVNGVQCGSPALKEESFCFFHHRWREERIDLRAGQPQHEIVHLNLPVLEDANSIQVALMQVMRLVLAKQLDNKTAGLLLYGLQTASCNLRHASFEPPERKTIVTDPATVATSTLPPDKESRSAHDHEYYLEGYEQERAALLDERLLRQASALSGIAPAHAEVPLAQVIPQNTPAFDVLGGDAVEEPAKEKEEEEELSLADYLPGGRPATMRMLGGFDAQKRFGPKKDLPVDRGRVAS